MPFKDFPADDQGIQLLQRSLGRSRLAHAYLFAGPDPEKLESVARTLAMTLNCLKPVQENGQPVDACGLCAPCRKIASGSFADVRWVRPESKMRVVTVDQMRELIQQMNLKPSEGKYKVHIVVAADRLNPNAANAFLKTLEEPPERSVLVLLTSEPQRMLDTITSRCMRLNFAGLGAKQWTQEQLEWLASLGSMAATQQKSLLGRYRILDVLLGRLGQIKTAITEQMEAASPGEKFKDAEKTLRDRWDDELKAAIEAEYRRQRGEILTLFQDWLRDIWLLTIFRSDSKAGSEPGAAPLMSFTLKETETVASRLTPARAAENLKTLEQLQRWLGTNVQEALAMELGLLKLHF
jgi:DNA polymerase-3 subunit delta'